MVKHTDKLFGRVWPLREIGAKRVNIQRIYNMHFSFNFGWHTMVEIRKNKQVNSVIFPGGESLGGGAARFFAYLQVPGVQD